MTALLPRDLADCADGARRYRRAAVLAGVVVGGATVGLLALSGWFIAAAALAGSAGPLAARSFNFLIPSAFIRLLAILRTLARYGERLLGHRAALSTLASIRSRLFLKAAAAEAGGVVTLSGGQAATLLGADVDQLEDRLIRGSAIAGSAAAGALAVALAMLASVTSAIAVAVCLGFTLWITRYWSSRVLPRRTDAVADALTDMKVGMTEHLAAAGEIAVYGLGERVAEALGRAAERHDHAMLRLAVAEARIAALVPAMGGVAAAFAIATAGGNVPVVAMVALATAAAAESLGSIVRTQIRAPTVDAALARLNTIAAVPERAVAATPRLLAAPGLTITSGTAVHALAPGTRTEIAGRSGTGKTRLLETLMGLRTDAPELVSVGDADAKMLGLYSLREIFALVPQAPGLIAGTILDNLRLAAPGLSEAQIWEALAVACLDDEVRALPEGLDQWVGGDGAGLSGGQQKRLALARGLLTGRPWLLLDEPTEGLDAATEARLVLRLKEWLDRSETGLLVATHRPAIGDLCARRIALG